MKPSILTEYGTWLFFVQLCLQKSHIERSCERGKVSDVSFKRNRVNFYLKWHNVTFISVKIRFVYCFQTYRATRFSKPSDSREPPCINHLDSDETLIQTCSRIHKTFLIILSHSPKSLTVSIMWKEIFQSTFELELKPPPHHLITWSKAVPRGSV